MKRGRVRGPSWYHPSPRPGLRPRPKNVLAQMRMRGQCPGSVALVQFILAFASFLHSAMNFLRSLPCSVLVSASFEHSSEAAVRGAAAFFSAGAIFVSGAVFAAGAGAAVCANAEPTSSSDAMAVAATRDERLIMA